MPYFAAVPVDEIVKETDAALLLRVVDDEHWVPKSLIDEPEQYSEGDFDTDVMVAKWFCVKEDIPFN